MNNRGAALIIVFAVILVLAILGSAILSRSISENNIAQRYSESTQAFWLAESGINRALYELRNNYDLNSVSATALGQGGYQVSIAQSGQNRIVTATGYIPFTGQARASRIIEATMSKTIPPDFYENAIYSGGDIDLNGNAYQVNGKVRYADELDYQHDYITGTETQDPSISPLARFDFTQMRALSVAQQNLYVVSGNKLINQATGSEAFPSSFWFSPPTDINDGTTGTPNIVYIEGDLALNGNIGTIGGFFVVVGNVITDPNATEDASINGNGQVEGAIYTRGDFDINGGAGNLNINGGVWAGDEAEMNGNTNITYNKVYMDSIKFLNLDASVQISAWRDTQNPYPLTQ